MAINPTSVGRWISRDSLPGNDGVNLAETLAKVRAKSRSELA
jgi:hypothetical protein